MAAPACTLNGTAAGLSGHEDGTDADCFVPIRVSGKSKSAHFSSFADKSLIMLPLQQPGMRSDAEFFFNDRSSTAMALVDGMKLPTEYAGEHLANPP
ncbi:MAG: hypothetical protein IPM89_13695 [Candidatus Competibacteraceae bacterium]|nr:MAG: hypothetical protein IPM89_13695 [Candidatus Competibacteraceae bacterium]